MADGAIDEQTLQRRLCDVENANFAGSIYSQKCTLILTDGHGAKSLVLAGLNEVPDGRDWYGVYPLERRLINVSKTERKHVEKDKVVLDLANILGLSIEKDYEPQEKLNYGRVMLMMNRDEDGSHKKGLLINLFRCYWPSLFFRRFIQQFITPVVKVTKGKEKDISTRYFYSYQAFKCDSEMYSLEDRSITHYRSLETFTSDEIKRFFLYMDDHRVEFICNHNVQPTYLDQCYQSFTVSFDKGFENARKSWLKEPQEPEGPLMYNKGMKIITYQDFIHKELKFYSKLHNKRSFRSIIDGLKRSERNVLHACFENWADKEVNVLALIHSVLEDLGYRQSVKSVGQIIINMAQDFVGKNNINVLMPLGQFGTRFRGGEDAGTVENLRTKLQDFSKLLFSVSENTPFPKDRKILDISTETWNYFPIIPMILVNGCSGIGTGFKTEILSYNPIDIIENIFRLMKGMEPIEMIPWFRGFKGKVEKTNTNEFRIYGDVSELVGNEISITELPISMWTQDYKQKTLEPLLKDKKSAPRVVRYTEHHTDTSVHFRVTLADIPHNYRKEDFLIFFRLYTDKTQILVALDISNSAKEYATVTDILKEFYDIRLANYESTRQDQDSKVNDPISKQQYEWGQGLQKNEVSVYEYNEIKLENPSQCEAFYVSNLRIQELDEKIRIPSTDLQTQHLETPKDLWKSHLEKLHASLLTLLSG